MNPSTPTLLLFAQQFNGHAMGAVVYGLRSAKTIPSHGESLIGGLVACRNFGTILAGGGCAIVQ